MKTNKHALNTTLIGLMFAAMLIGCGKKSPNHNVNLTFANSTASALAAELQDVGVHGMLRAISVQSGLLGVTPDIYQMKLVAFYLVEDTNENQDNVGNVARIWTSNKCDADLTLCGINPEHSGSYVVDYFDFAKGSAAVNETFNSYARNTAESQVAAGTYRYLRMDFTGKVFSDSDRTANLKFGADAASEVRAQNGSFSMALPEPLVMTEAGGESFTVDLAYDLANRFYASGTYVQPPEEVAASQSWTCDGTGSGIPCVVEVNFAPTVTKH